jgi:hypothetical protein
MSILIWTTLIDIKFIETIGHCFPLPSSPLSSLCNRLNIFDTAGSDFFQLCVQWSVVVPEHQGQPGRCPHSRDVILGNTKKPEVYKLGD